MEDNRKQETDRNSSKALLLYQQAQRKLHPSCCESIFTSSEDRIDSAFELLYEAAKLYTIDKEYSEAARCYTECAEIKQINKEPSIEYYEEALKLYFKAKDSNKYQEILAKCVESALSTGKFNQAADYVYESAQNLEEETKFKESIEAYDLAVNYYEMDKDAKRNTINQIKVKRADLLCITGDPKAKEEARAIYEQIGTLYLASPSTEQQSKDELAKCVICYLIYDDYLSGRAFLHKFYDINYSFKGSSIGVFLEELIEALEESSMDKFSQCFSEYKANAKKAWTSWMSVMISQIESKIRNSEVNQANYAEEDDFK